ncbi:MAG: hypothetical protein IJO79_01785 [Firmicutes bacterium]|nr:hypothetical protein [Clostridiales bacterium]MBQ9931060.1 hypothetical protein [Bacillota bacterium]
MTPLSWGIFIVAAVVFIIGGLTILYHLVFGLDKTGLTDKYPWGLNIQGFYALSSFGTGLLAMMSALVIFMGAAFPVEIFRLGASIALALLLAGIFLMGADLGKPTRAMKIATGGRPNSPLFIDFVTLIVLVILSLILTCGLGTGSAMGMKAWAYITLLIAVLCMSAHTMLIAPRLAAGFKGSPFFAMETVILALWGGTAILAVMTKNDAASNEIVLPILTVLSAIALILALSAKIAGSLADKKVHNGAFVGLALIALILMIVWDLTAASPIIWIVAAVLAVIAVFVEKCESLLIQQMHFMTDGPHQYDLETKPSYKPHATEIGNLLCGIAFVVVLPYVVIIIRTFLF